MIEIFNLEKRFGKLKVLDNLSLKIDRGKIIGIVGPNGSGKTTLIKCILGLTKPDKGTIIVNEHTLNGDWQYRRDIGYMPQYGRFPENLTVEEIISLVEDMRRGIKKLDRDLFHCFNLHQEKAKKIRTLSGGTRQKLSALIAFLFNPELLILDEPTAGLDPQASSLLKDKILQDKAKGKTVIITSHIMSELEELSDEIVFILSGKIKFKGSVKSIFENTRELKLERAVANLMGNPVQ